MKTFEDFDEGEFFFRHIMSVPVPQRLDIVHQLIRTARQRGSTGGMADIIDFLEGAEFETLAAAIGKRLPCKEDENEFVDALVAFLLSEGKTTDRRSDFCAFGASR